MGFSFNSLICPVHAKKLPISQLTEQFALQELLVQKRGDLAGLLAIIVLLLSLLGSLLVDRFLLFRTL